MSIVFQWDLKLIFWHCHIYEKTLITGIISSEKTIWSQVHGGVPAAPIQLEGEEQLREAESQNSQVKKTFPFFTQLHFSHPFLSSFLSSLLWWIQQPSRKDLFSSNSLRYLLPWFAASELLLPSIPLNRLNRLILNYNGLSPSSLLAHPLKV